MTEQPPKASASEILQIMIAEHNNLQAIRSGTIYESAGRTTLYLGAVSSSLVALAFIGQMSEMGSAFIIFALILLPSLIFLGVVTFIRVYQTGTEDMVAARGINRIRHYYTEVAPDLERYFILSTHDDMKGMLTNMGVQKQGWWQLFVSTHGLVGVINSILAAVFVGLVTSFLLNTSIPIAILCGVVIFLISEYLHFRYQNNAYEQSEQSLKVLFPSDNSIDSPLNLPKS
jgi:hypothetical protein